MKLYKTAGIGISVLCSVSIPALAQSSQESCTRLQQVTEQNRTRFNPEWVRQAEKVIQSRDEKNCQRYAEQAEGAAKQLDQQAANGQQQATEQQSQKTAQQSTKQSEQLKQDQQAQTTEQAKGQQQGQSAEAAGGQIMVTHPQPQVTIQQQAPQVEVV